MPPRDAKTQQLKDVVDEVPTQGRSYFVYLIFRNALCLNLIFLIISTSPRTTTILIGIQELHVIVASSNYLMLLSLYKVSSGLVFNKYHISASDNFLDN